MLLNCAFIGGIYLKNLDNFADYIKIKHCLGVGNETDALFIALKCLEIKLIL